MSFIPFLDLILKTGPSNANDDIINALSHVFVSLISCNDEWGNRTRTMEHPVEISYLPNDLTIPFLFQQQILRETGLKRRLEAISRILTYMKRRGGCPGFLLIDMNWALQLIQRNRAPWRLPRFPARKLWTNWRSLLKDIGRRDHEALRLCANLA